jgi:hypothetical protein
MSVFFKIVFLARFANACRCRGSLLRKKFRTPREKKRLSLERDRRAYGSNLKKPARRAAPQRKRLANRHRRRAEEGIRQIDAKSCFRAEELESKVCGREQLACRKRWRKWPSISLREFIQLQRKRRTSREGRKKRIERLLSPRPR